MRVGHKGFSTVGGMIASAMTLAAILAAKVVVIELVLARQGLGRSIFDLDSTKLGFYFLSPIGLIIIAIGMGAAYRTGQRFFQLGIPTSIIDVDQNSFSFFVRAGRMVTLNGQQLLGFDRYDACLLMRQFATARLDLHLRPAARWFPLPSLLPPPALPGRGLDGQRADNPLPKPLPLPLRQFSLMGSIAIDACLRRPTSADRITSTGIRSRITLYKTDSRFHRHVAFIFGN